jgi:hypothetical protein
MQPEVKQASAAVEFETNERCHITEIANDPGDEFAGSHIGTLYNRFRTGPG